MQHRLIGKSRRWIRLLSKLRVSRLWGDDPERFWPFLRRPVARATLWLAPSYGYGAERVPRDGGFVLAANHLSAIDPSLIGILSPRTIYYMAKVELLSVPVIGWALMQTGGFPVRRGQSDRESLRLARAIAGEGHVVGVFVEGTRQRFGYPGKVNSGAVMIARREGVPIVPCGVYSFGWTRKNRQPCAVVFGEPLDLDGLPGSGRGYREAAEELGAEIVKLWRLAAEATAAEFPLELPDGSKRSGAHYPPLATALGRSMQRGSTVWSAHLDSMVGDDRDALVDRPRRPAAAAESSRSRRPV